MKKLLNEWKKYLAESLNEQGKEPVLVSKATYNPSNNRGLREDSLDYISGKNDLVQEVRIALEKVVMLANNVRAKQELDKEALSVLFRVIKVVETIMETTRDFQTNDVRYKKFVSDRVFPAAKLVDKYNKIDFKPYFNIKDAGPLQDPKMEALKQSVIRLKNGLMMLVPEAPPA